LVPLAEAGTVEEEVVGMIYWVGMNPLKPSNAFLAHCGNKKDLDPRGSAKEQDKGQFRSLQPWTSTMEVGVLERENEIWD